MSQSLLQIKNRIRSIENTKKITRAMEMVAAAKLKPLENQLRIAKKYSLKIESLLNNLLSQGVVCKHPFLEQRREIKRIAVCVVTSDTGLCGSYNHNIIRATEEFLSTQGALSVDLVCVGKKGYNYFRKRKACIIASYNEFHGKYADEAVNALVAVLSGLFLSGKADKIYLAYTKFTSSSRQAPCVDTFLNLEASVGKDVDYLIEPDSATVLTELIATFINAKMRTVLLDAFISEHSSRVMAMGEATDNAKELLEELVLLRNKVRQASITRDIMEIVSAAEALKG